MSPRLSRIGALGAARRFVTKCLLWDTGVPDSSTSFSFRDTAASDTTWVALSPGRAYYSDDGLSWSYKTILTSTLSQELRICVYGNGYFLALGSLGGNWRSSDGGANWTAKNNVGNAPGAARYGFGKFVVGTYASSTLYAYRSTDDGETWSSATVTTGNVRPYELVVTDSNYIMFYSKSDLSDGYCATSSDAASWSSATSPGVVYYGQAAAIGSTIVVSNTDSTFKVSTDEASTWTDVTVPTISGSWYITTVALSSKEMFVAVADDGYYITSDDGSTWTDLCPIDGYTAVGIPDVTGSADRVCITDYSDQDWVTTF